MNQDLGPGAKAPSRSNKHNLHIPNLSLVNNNHANGKLPGITPPLYTPGGRRLPPLGLSPPPLQTAETPGLWNSLLSATNNTVDANGNATQTGGQNGDQSLGTGLNGSFGSNSAYSQFLNSLKKTGLTPNESNLRSGLTPSATGFPFSTQFPGLSTPGGMITGPITPGLSSIWNISGTSQGMINTTNNSNTAQQSQPQVGPNNTNTLHNGTNNNLPQPNNTTLPPIPSLQGVDQTNGAKLFVQPPQPPQPISQKIMNDMDSSFTSEPLSKNARAKRKAGASKRDAKKAKIDSGSTDKLGKSDSGSDNKDDDGDVDGEDDEDELDKDENGSNGQSKSGKGSRKKAGFTEEEKRKNFLERNRVAASKCRQRKKQLIHKMEEELMFYSSGYRELSVQIGQLRDRLVIAKNLLVGHKDCPMLVQTVGGFQQMNNLFQQLNEAIQISGRTHTDPSAIPSTVPTTLNNTAMLPPNGPIMVNGTDATDSKPMLTAYAPSVGMPPPDVKIEVNGNNPVGS